jgi:hypothetical protein
MQEPLDVLALPAGNSPPAALLQFAFVIPRTKNALFMVQIGGTEYAIVQIVPAKPAIRLSLALFTHGDSAPSGLQIAGSVHSISMVLGSSERPPPTASGKLPCRPILQEQLGFVAWMLSEGCKLISSEQKASSS